MDRALDAGLLLSGLHFDNGFGDYRNDGLKIARDVGTLPVYAKLAAQFKALSRFVSEKADTTSGAVDDFRIYLDNRHVGRDRLIRLSATRTILGRGRSAAGRRKAYSRIDLLDDNLVMRQSGAFHSNDTAVNDGDEFDWFLRNIVKRGFDRVVTRVSVTTNDTMADERIEPSVLCPYVEFGDYISVDAQDIDAFLALRNVVENYVAQPKYDRPLALAVFGPPGSGKSFIVKQILKSIPLCKIDKGLEFNLSQVTSMEHLSRHFHRIQDSATSDAIPVAFFDEFDSPFNGIDVGWLKSFLMPLQDGLYTEGSEVFNVKKAIFVFAGGIAGSYAAFCDQYKGHTAQKAPDFISRLRGFMDVQEIALGVKRRRRGSVAAGGGFGSPLDNDRAAQLRRAVILRSMLLLKLPQIVDKGSKFARIENEIVDAFLHVKKFKYGVRSMEAIIEMSRMPQSASSFLRSSLPPSAQIEMHVNAEEFLKIVHENRHGSGGEE